MWQETVTFLDTFSIEITKKLIKSKKYFEDFKK